MNPVRSVQKFKIRLMRSTMNLKVNLVSVYKTFQTFIWSTVYSAQNDDYVKGMSCYKENSLNFGRECKCGAYAFEVLVDRRLIT